MNVPVNEPVVTDAAKKYVNDALDTGWISSAGTYIEKFENAFADYIGVNHAVMTTSGTTALHLALAALEIGEGDEVIVPDFTMISSVFAVLYAGAKPVFVDAEDESFCIDVNKIEEKITDKTKVIMPVHIYGHTCDMDPIMEIAEKHQITVLEDAAEVHGATYKGKKCGSMGQINAFSFYGNKIVTTGEGGMVVTNDDQLAEKARSFKNLAHSPQKRFFHEHIGFNYRATNLQGAIGLGQLESIDQFLAHKKWMASEYEKNLKDIPGMKLPVTKDYAENVYWMYGVVLEDSFGMSRDDFCKALKEKGVDTRDFFYSSASQPVLKPYVTEGESFPVSEFLASHGFYVPSGLALTQEQLDHVCHAIKEVTATN